VEEESLLLTDKMRGLTPSFPGPFFHLPHCAGAMNGTNGTLGTTKFAVSSPLYSLYPPSMCPKMATIPNSQTWFLKDGIGYEWERDQTSNYEGGWFTSFWIRKTWNFTPAPFDWHHGYSIGQGIARRSGPSESQLYDELYMVVSTFGNS